MAVTLPGNYCAMLCIFSMYCSKQPNKKNILHREEALPEGIEGGSPVCVLSCPNPMRMWIFTFHRYSFYWIRATSTPSCHQLCAALHNCDTTSLKSSESWEASE